MSRELITLTKYVGCTLGLILFRATELELDPKSEESEHWVSFLSHAFGDATGTSGVKKIQGSPESCSSFPEFPRACLQLMLLLESPFQ